MSDSHIKSTGNMNAIRDWLNASLYNKEEIQNLFIDHNGSGLKAYDLTITGEPEQMIKMVGQTSGRTYNVCLAAILGDDMKETVLWTNSGNSNPQTITLDDDYTNYKLLLVVAVGFGQICTCLVPVSVILNVSNVAIGAYGDSSYVWYTVNSTTGLTKKSEGGGLITYQILGYK